MKIGTIDMNSVEMIDWTIKGSGLINESIIEKIVSPPVI